MKKQTAWRLRKMPQCLSCLLSGKKELVLSIIYLLSTANTSIALLPLFPWYACSESFASLLSSCFWDFIKVIKTVCPSTSRQSVCREDVRSVTVVGFLMQHRPVIVRQSELMLFMKWQEEEESRVMCTFMATFRTSLFALFLPSLMQSHPSRVTSISLSLSFIYLLVLLLHFCRQTSKTK